jgi:hypothetical protein
MKYTLETIKQDAFTAETPNGFCNNDCLGKIEDLKRGFTYGHYKLFLKKRSP